MRPKAIADLVQLADRELFRELSLGMRAVVKNATALAEDAQILADANRQRSTELLLAVAAEEAAKYHILLDAVRCRRQGPGLSRQLKRFNDHLAKGLYAEYAHIAPASFGEVLEFLERERRTLYLDGPNDVDWIFRNGIIQGREETLYVDYVEAAGEHTWVEPAPRPTVGGGFHKPRALTLASLLSDAGFDEPAALSVIAGLWREVQFAPEDHWRTCHQRNLRTLEVLDQHGLLSVKRAEQAGRIAWDWLFPLHAVDLSPIQVERKELEAIQQSWLPEF